MKLNRTIYRLALLFLSVLNSRQLRAQATMPEQQKAYCAIFRTYVADLTEYERLIKDPFTAQQAKKPDPAKYNAMFFKVLGPSGEFTNWIGTIGASPTGNMTGMATLSFAFSCPAPPGIPSSTRLGGVFETQQIAQQDFRAFPGSGAQPFTAPVPAHLIALASHSSPAMVSGRLFKNIDDSYVASTGRGSSLIDAPFYLATFTRVAFPTQTAPPVH